MVCIHIYICISLGGHDFIIENVRLRKQQYLVVEAQNRERHPARKEKKSWPGKTKVKTLIFS